MGNLSGESREQKRKDKVTKFSSITSTSVWFSPQSLNGISSNSLYRPYQEGRGRR